MVLASDVPPHNYGMEALRLTAATRNSFHLRCLLSLVVTSSVFPIQDILPNSKWHKPNGSNSLPCISCFPGSFFWSTKSNSLSCPAHQLSIQSAGLSANNPHSMNMALNLEVQVGSVTTSLPMPRPESKERLEHTFNNTVIHSICWNILLRKQHSKISYKHFWNCSNVIKFLGLGESHQLLGFY